MCRKIWTAKIQSGTSDLAKSELVESHTRIRGSHTSCETERFWAMGHYNLGTCAAPPPSVCLCLSLKKILKKILKKTDAHRHDRGGGRHTLLIDLSSDLLRGAGRPAAHRSGSQQPLLQCVGALFRDAPPSASQPCSKSVTWPSRSLMKAGAYRRSSCLICSASTRGSETARAAGSGVGAWDWPSAKELVEAHGGRIRTESGGTGLGTRHKEIACASWQARVM